MASTLPDATASPTAFVDETRAHWRDAGLPEDPVDGMARDVRQVLGFWRGLDPAIVARNHFDGRTYIVRGVDDANRLAAFLVRHGARLFAEDNVAIRAGAVTVRCTLCVAAVEGVCYVSAWDYLVELIRFDGTPRRLRFLARP